MSSPINDLKLAVVDLTQFLLENMNQPTVSLKAEQEFQLKFDIFHDVLFEIKHAGVSDLTLETLLDPIARGVPQEKIGEFEKYFDLMLARVYGRREQAPQILN